MITINTFPCCAKSFSISALGALVALLGTGRPGQAAPTALTGPAATNAPTVWADLGAKATAQYSGDGLTVATAADGAVWLRCAFQKLDGEVIGEGLWLNSTVAGAAASRFRVVAGRVGRDGAEWSAGIFAGVEIGQPTISPTKMSALRRPGAWPQCAVGEPWNLSSL